ncbi:bifunctional PIG-L family deacetylase/class I SAM-dependent methyltransferase [Microbacterium limosum]|uniref:Bifunctional PIG-L family deacetylase/class I SAM-dependent methyltransferase n=1 Tax=Microbacterium limosum TaxID=3079935 RepID=A0AAU0MH76_9MICO|nr:bifunctional PIG-L family deacetylase/class I SAM-dependent methyltransferase [Microbacterium sp. Y20]WOQ69372.1 bifunctional PIG-L family deacetylase/class I SAM-dependent methyltransferase [Microbacterium sp. Y20]
MTTVFDHREAGTGESEWREHAPWRSSPELRIDAAALDALVVCAAHPDDETLGAGGLLATAAAHGIPCTVIIATDGEASHPGSPTWTAPALARARRTEATRALDVLAPGSAVHFLGLGDGMLRERRSRLARGVDAIVGATEGPRVLVVAPWDGDGHRDHRVMGEVAASAARRAGARYAGYPVWLWHWGDPAAVRTDGWMRLELCPDVRAAKARALRLHASQTQPLSPAEGDEAILSPEMLAHFERDTEVFVTPAPPTPTPPTGSLDAAFFDGFYARHTDPWGFESRWYERRKRDLLLAALPRPRYGSALELGCATGLLTERLAERCDSVVALDIAQSALDRASARIGADARVTLVRARLPEEWPSGRFELIVLSEIAYYWDADDRARALARLRESLAPDGALVACHWRHPVADHPASGDEVHAALRRIPGLHGAVRHEEDDFLLDVLVPDSTPSVARAEGLAP